MSLMTLIEGFKGFICVDCKKKIIADKVELFIDVIFEEGDFAPIKEVRQISLCDKCKQKRERKEEAENTNG